MAAALGRSLPFHYGWLIVAVGTLTIFACLGLGRFGLGMLLPSMGEALALNYSEMGLISTANFVGYLAAVIVCPGMIRNWGESRVIVCGLVVVSVSMGLVSLGNNFYWVFVFYAVTGFGSGMANVSMMVLVVHWFERPYRGRAAGFIVIGSGFAIIFSGALVPQINLSFGLAGWRYSWAVFGGIVAVVALLASRLMRDRPADMDLKAVGAGEEAATMLPTVTAVAALSSRRPIAQLGLLYLVFGATYMIFATFIVTTLVQDRGFSEATAGQVWAWVGGFSLLSGPLFGALSDRAGTRIGLCAVFTVHTLSYALVAAHLPDVSLYFSIALFGVAAWSIPGIMATAVADYVKPEKVAAALSMVTIFFAVGQILGPAAAGIIADFRGSFGASFTLAAVLAAVGGLAALTLPGRQVP